MKRKTIFQDAVDNWPEDEAYCVYESYHDAISDSLGDSAYAQNLLMEDIHHFRKVFSNESDYSALMIRFLDKLAELVPNEIDLINSERN